MPPRAAAAAFGAPRPGSRAPRPRTAALVIMTIGVAWNDTQVMITTPGLWPARRGWLGGAGVTGGSRLGGGRRAGGSSAGAGALGAASAGAGALGAGGGGALAGAGQAAGGLAGPGRGKP